MKKSAALRTSRSRPSRHSLTLSDAAEPSPLRGLSLGMRRAPAFSSPSFVHVHGDRQPGPEAVA